MKLSLLMAACNQCDEVHKTLGSALPALEASGHDWEVIVFDDASTDGCCERMPDNVRLIRSEKRLGCPEARQRLAKLATGEIMVWTDPHCRYPVDCFSRLAEAALTNDALIQPRSRPRAHKKPIYGARIEFRNAHAGLRCDRNFRRARDVMGLYGTVYCIRSELYRKAGWMPLRGRYGQQELGFGLALWFAGIPVLLLEDLVCIHKVRRTYSPNGEEFTYSHNDRDRVANVLGVHYGWFEDTWEEFWLPRFRKWRKKIDIERYVARPHMQMLRQWCNDRKRRTESMFFGALRDAAHKTGGYILEEFQYAANKVGGHVLNDFNGEMEK